MYLLIISLTNSEGESWYRLLILFITPSNAIVRLRDWPLRCVNVKSISLPLDPYKIISFCLSVNFLNGLSMLILNTSHTRFNIVG